jgi:hypothetical protein
MFTPLASLLILAGPAAPVTSDGPTPAEAVALTAPKLGADAIEFEAGEGGGLSLRAWGQRPGTWVAMIPDVNEPDKTGRDSATLRLAVLARNDQRWTAIARAEEVRTADDLECSDPSYTLDLAPYRLNDTEVAFGVRERTKCLSVTRPGASEFLFLYRVVGARLVRVLSLEALIEWTDEDGAGTLTDRSTVAVSKNKTGGFFDLVVTSRGDSRPKKTVTTYTWTGEAYREVERPKVTKRSTKSTRPARR